MATAVAHVAVGVLALSGVGQAMAANYWWDTNSTTSGSSGGTTAPGTWNTTNTNWTTTAAGTAATVAWLNDGSATAVFSAGSNATGSYTVTIGGTVTAAGVTTEEGTVTITGGNLTLAAGALTAGSSLTINTPITTTFSTPIIKGGSNSLFIGAADTFTNAINVTAGVLQITKAGSLASAGDVTLSTGTALVIDNSASNVADRLNNASQVVYQGGANFAFTGATGYATNEVVGNIVVSNDSTLNTATAANNTTTNFLTLNGGTGGTTLTAASLQVQPAAMLTIRGANLGTASNQFKLADGGASLTIRGAGGSGTTKSIVNGVLGSPATSGVGTDFVTYNATNGFSVLGAGDYASSITSGDTSKQNVSIGSAQTVTANTTINSLKTTAGGSVTINPGSTLSLSSGMMLLTAPTTISGGTLGAPSDTPIVAVTQQDSAISSAIAGGSAFYKNGTGTLTLSGNSTYTGQTVVAAGTLVASSNNALGDSSQGTVVQQGATLQLNGNVTTAETISIYGRAPGVIRNVLTYAQAIDSLNLPTGWVGGLDNVGNNTVNGDILLSGTGAGVANINAPTISNSSGTLTINGTIKDDPAVAGGHSLFFTGVGTTVLTHANTFTGIVRPLGGTVVLQDAEAFPTGMQVYMLGTNSSDKATIALQAPAGNPGLTYNFTLGQLAGYGAGAHGPLVNLGGDNTLTGNIAIYNTAGGGNANYNSFSPTYLGIEAGSLTLTGLFTNTTGGARHLVKTGPGDLILSSATNGQGVGGPIDVTAGSLVFAQNSVNVPPSSFASAATSNVNVYDGASLVFDQTAADPNSSAAAFIDPSYGGGPLLNEPINLFGGEMKVIGNTSLPTGPDFTQPGQIGFMTLNAYGMSTLTVVPTGNDTVIIAPTRANGETYLIRGIGTNARILLNKDGSGLVGGSGAAGTSTVSILPYAIGDTSATGIGTDFVTYDAGANSFRPLSGSEYAALSVGTATLDNATATGTVAVGSATGVNSLKLTGATLNLSNTLSVNSGAILATGGNSSLNGGTIALGGNEGVFYATSGNTLSVGSTVSGSNGLTLAGKGTINLTGNNTFTGKLQVNGGTVNVNNDGNLGDPSATLTLAGGTLVPAAGFTSTGRGVTLLGQPTIGLSGGQSFSLTGVVSGAGQLGVSGNGTLYLTGSNTWTGPALVNNGATLSVATVDALGPAQASGGAQASRQIQLDGGTLQFTASMDLGNGRPIFLGKGGGTLDVADGATVTWDPSSGTPMYGPGTLIKTGGGTWEFKGNSPGYNGGTVINGGILQIDVNNTLPAAYASITTTVNNGGEFRIAATAAVTAQDVVLNDGATFSGVGTAAYNGGGAVTSGNPQIAAGANVTLKAPDAADTFTIGAAMVNVGTGPAPTINIAGAGNVVISRAPSAGFVSNFNVHSGANLTLSAANTTISGTLTTAGAVKVSSTTTAGRVVQTGGSPIDINGNSAKLTIAANGTSTSVLTDVPTFTGTAPKLDITNNKVAIDYTGGSVVSSLRAALAGGAKFTGNVPAWNGAGIVSANAAADANKVTAIGYLESSVKLGPSGGTYGDVSVDGSAILLKYTYFGDINLDGTVSGDDYALMDRGMAKGLAAGTATWLDGDVNYDGAVTSSDYFLADTAYGHLAGVLSPGFLAQRESQFGSEYVSQLVAAVPEPTSLGIIGLGALGFLGGRRRRQS